MERETVEVHRGTFQEKKKKNRLHIVAFFCWLPKREEKMPALGLVKMQMGCIHKDGGSNSSYNR